MTGRPPSWLRELRRAVSWHRRLLAAGLAAVAVAAGLTALTPAPPPSVGVVAAARDLAAGSTVTAADVRTVALPAAAVPSGAVRSDADVVGRVLAGPVRRGEPLTDVRLAGPRLLEGYGDDLVAAPVRVADAEVARLLRPGDRVDVLAAPTDAVAGSATVVAPGVRVLVVPAYGEDGPAYGDGALLVVATTPETAASLATAAVTSRLSITLHG